MNSPAMTRIPATSLQRSVEQTVCDGRLGTIVSLRMMMSAGDRSVEQLAGWLNWAAGLFSCEEGKLFADRDAAGRQLSVLCSLSSGATVSLTAVSYPASSDMPTNALQLLLIGQHGIARLQGGDDIDPTLMTMNESATRWINAIEQSVKAQSAIKVT